MPAKQLKLIQTPPTFDIPDKYKENEWKIKEWDIYKNAPIDRQYVWNEYSNATDGIFKFSFCKNIFIAEEFKYFMYYLVEIKRVAITTFARYYDRYRVLAEYISAYMANSNSILELEDLSLFEFYLSTKKNNIASAKGKTSFSEDVFNRAVKHSKLTTFIAYSQSIIKEYYEQDIPETQKLIWHPQKIPFCTGKDCGRLLDFREIKNPVILKNVQAFCLYKLHNITFGGVCAYLLDIKLFIRWIEEHHPLNNLNTINRDILEKYFSWLRTSSGYSSIKVNTAILNLKVFFDWGLLVENKDMPQQQLFLNNDYVLKIKKKADTSQMKKSKVW